MLAVRQRENLPGWRGASGENLVGWIFVFVLSSTPPQNSRAYAKPPPLGSIGTTCTKRTKKLTLVVFGLVWYLFRYNVSSYNWQSYVPCKRDHFKRKVASNFQPSVFEGLFVSLRGEYMSEKNSENSSWTRNEDHKKIGQWLMRCSSLFFVLKGSGYSECVSACFQILRGVNQFLDAEWSLFCRIL